MKPKIYTLFMIPPEVVKMTLRETPLWQKRQQLDELRKKQLPERWPKEMNEPQPAGFISTSNAPLAAIARRSVDSSSMPSR